MKKSNQLVVLAAILVLISVKAIGGLELVTLGSIQYYFSGITDELTWDAASAFCQENKLKLVTVDSNEKSDLIDAYLKSLYTPPWYHDFWLGGTDVAQEGSWVWSATGVPVVFNKWQPGEPNGDNTINCMSNSEYLNGSWHDLPCDNIQAFICEKIKCK